MDDSTAQLDRVIERLRHEWVTLEETYGEKLSILTEGGGSEKYSIVLQYRVNDAVMQLFLYTNDDGTIESGVTTPRAIEAVKNK